MFPSIKWFPRAALTFAAALVVIAPVGAPAYAREIRGSDDQAILNWNTRQIKLDLDPGETANFEISLTARQALNDVTLGATGAAGEFVAVDPVRLGDVTGGSVMSLRLQVTVPSQTTPGVYPGSVRVFRNGIQFAVPLLLLIKVLPARYLYSVAVDLSNNHVWRALVTGKDLDKNFVATQDDPFDVAATSTHVYWTEAGPGTIGRATRDGAIVDLPLVNLGEDWLPRGIATAGQYVYWIAAYCPNSCNSGGLQAPTRIGRAKLDGTSINAALITLPYEASHVAVSDSHIYWTTSDTIRRSNLNGSGQETFVTGVGVGDLATANGTVYWTILYGDRIGRQAENFTFFEPAFLHLPMQLHLSGLAVDNKYLYFSSWDNDLISRATVGGTDLDVHFIETQSADVAVEPN